RARQTDYGVKSMKQASCGDVACGFSSGKPGVFWAKLLMVGPNDVGPKMSLKSWLNWAGQPACGGSPPSACASAAMPTASAPASAPTRKIRFACMALSPHDGHAPHARAGTREVSDDPRRLSRQFAVSTLQNVLFIHACEQASHNGDLVHAVEAGVLTREDVSQLGDVLIGTAEGRTSDGDMTVFDSTGLAIQDLAIALAAMERAGELDPPTIDL